MKSAYITKALLQGQLWYSPKDIAGSLWNKRLFIFMKSINIHEDDYVKLYLLHNHM